MVWTENNGLNKKDNIIYLFHYYNNHYNYFLGGWNKKANQTFSFVQQVYGGKCGAH